MEKYIAAIDLGTKKVAAAVGELTPQGVRIVAYSQVQSRGMNHGRIENPQQASNAIKAAVKELQDKYHLSIKKCYIGVAGHDIKCIHTEPVQTQRSVANEMITQEEIHAITKGMFETVLDNGYKVQEAIAQSYNVDNNMSVSQAVGMIGKNIVSRYKLIIGKETFTHLTESTLGFAGLKMKECVVEPIATAEAVISDDEKDAGVVVVDIGAGTTDVVVIQNSIIRHVGIVPFGGNSITNDICTAYKIAPKQAETLKVNYGCCFSDYAENKAIILKSLSNKDIQVQLKTLSKIIQARMEEILEAVAYHVEQSGFAKALRAGYVFTGGGSQIKNLVNLANYITGKEAQVVKPSSGVTITYDSLDEAKQAYSSTVVGLILYGFKKGEEDGLYNYDFVSKNIDMQPENVDKEKIVEEVVRNETQTNTRKRNKSEKNGKGGWGGLFKSLNLFPDSNNDNNEDLNAA